MLQIPEMLMVGAAGSNTGKTQLICSVIEHFSRHQPVVGIKVTTVEAHHAHCPRRNGEGCGVCSALDQDFVVTEEDSPSPDKDTGRMLAAGAERVLWLRARRGFLRDGINAALDKIGKGYPVVCESTSLRSVVEPAAFLIVTRKDTSSRKLSARTAWDYADRLVEYDGERFDLDLEEINIENNRFCVKRKATAAILAGGASTRMKADKSLLPIGDKTMIDHVFRALQPHFQDILVSANDKDKFAFLGVDVVPDEVPGQGPLMGIKSVLAKSPHDLTFVHACDIPITDVDVMSGIMRLASDADAVIPRNPNGHLEPLFAVYRKSVLPALENVLATEERRIHKALELCRVKYLELDRNDQIRNLNTEADLRSFLEGA